MRYLMLIFICLSFNLKAQKPTIKLDTYQEWPTVTGGNLNNDGTYAYYFINNSPVGHNTFVIIKPATEEKVSMEDVSSPTFSDDSKILYGKLPNDTMFIYRMETKEIKKIANVSSFYLFKTEKVENIAIVTTDQKLNIKLGNSNRTKTFENVLDFKISPIGNAIAIKTTNATDTTHKENIIWIDIPNFNSKSIFKAKNIDNIIFDGAGQQLAFFAMLKNAHTIWLFDKSSSKTKEVVTSNQYENDKNVLDYNIFTFSNDRKFIFFTTTNKTSPVDSIKSNPLEVWNYEDRYLQSQFYSELPVLLSKQNVYSVNLEDSKVIPLLKGNQKMLANTFRSQTDGYIIIADSYKNLGSEGSSNSNISYWLCSTKTGRMTEFIGNRNTTIAEIQISPSSKYINYYDPQVDSYFGFNIKSKKTINLSLSLKRQLTNYERQQEIKPEIYSLGTIGYLGSDENIIVRGTYDLWCINQDSTIAPINLTQGMGSKEKIIFGPIKQNENQFYGTLGSMMLTAFNTITKEFGFYSFNYNHGKPQIIKLSSGNYCISTPLLPYSAMSSVEFIMAKKKQAFLLLKQSADNSPNYYYSQDLKYFKNLSKINPERKYNWLHSELLYYSDSLGNQYTGIIYKPENFDPNKKYPIVFDYYERQSNLLNAFPNIAPVSVNLNIPFAVSNDYIVILPDIKTSRSSPGEEALKTVLALAKFLSQYPWVDSLKMGLIGHSFGGLETNYIVSHTNKFTAAISGAGISDIISMAYDVWGIDGTSYQSYYQFAAPQMAESLADNPEIYLKNSPILHVSNINTPILLVHNDLDLAVPFRQSRQLFISLRSLNKPVWLLNYKGEGHGLGKEENITDYNNKIFGFFDYYLKNKAKPQWMISHN